MTEQNLLEKIVALCKRRGFVYPGSEIYGGLANTWDFGPLGVELKNNIKKLWWKRFVYDREDIFGLDGGILLNPKIWEASGHTKSFVDPLVECKSCHQRFRFDQLEGTSKCPECGGELTEPRLFNGMFKTFIGATEDSSSVAYLRPETAQAIFINFANIVNSFSPRLPFGIAQIGKAFRNEITTGQFIFRTLEFEQMEIEYFVNPGEDLKYFDEWRKIVFEWFVSLGLKRSNLRTYDHPKEKLAHYSKGTTDVEYRFPFGWSELQGTANRQDYDLKQHTKYSGVDLSFPTNRGEKITPFVIEPSFGVERLLLALILDAYEEEGSGKNKRVVLKLKPELAPYKVAIFPLLANKPKLVKKARDVFDLLRSKFHTAWDDRGNIGKRYYSQDEIGTPWCVTVDFQTLTDSTVTVRDRDTTQQERVAVSGLKDYFSSKLKN